MKGLRNTIRAAVRWPGQFGPFRLVGVAVTCPSFTFCSGFCCSKESGPVSIMSTLRLFGVSQGDYEKKENCKFTLILCLFFPTRHCLSRFMYYFKRETFV